MSGRLRVIRVAEVDIIIDPAALEKLATSPSGPVARELARYGAKIDATAKQLLTNDMVNVDSGRLRSSTTWKLFTDDGNLGVAIGSSVFYARIIHDGGTFSVAAHTRNVGAHTRRNRGGSGRHRVRAHTKRIGAHTRTVVARPYLVEAARRNGVKI